jgi:transcriptional regulator with XRE-family HTH domain
MNGRKLRAWRRFHHKTQYDVAKVTGWNRSKVSEFENNHIKPKKKEIEMLKEGLKKLLPG